MFPVSHILNGRSSFKPPPSKKPKKVITKQVLDWKKSKQVRFKENPKCSEDLMILEDQIQLAKEMMNKTAKEVECKKDAQKPKL